MYIEIFIIVLLLAAVGVGLWAVIRSYQIEKFKDTPAFQKQMKEEEKKEAKNCCAGCTTCTKYTRLAIKTMEGEGRSIEVKNLEGIIVDMRCYSQNKENWRDRHITAIGGIMEDCGKACAMQGIPVGLLCGCEPDQCNPGENGVYPPIYILLTASIPLAGYMQKKARVSGRLMRDSGGLYTTKIEIKNGEGKWEDINGEGKQEDIKNKGWKFINIKTPM